MSSWRVPDLAASVIRTVVPIAAGATLTWLAAHTNVVIDQNTAAAAMPWIVGATIGGYYFAGRWLERRRGDGWAVRAAQWIGRWMLGGVIRQPVYADPGTQLRVAGFTGTTQPPTIRGPRTGRPDH
nr:hypothetical protein [Micromonospora sp. DSM 115978]